MARKAQANNKASFVADRDTDSDIDDNYSDLDDRMDAQNVLAAAGRTPTQGMLSSDDMVLA